MSEPNRKTIWLVCSRRPIVAEFAMLARAAAARDFGVLIILTELGYESLLPPDLPERVTVVCAHELATPQAMGGWSRHAGHGLARKLSRAFRRAGRPIAADAVGTLEAVLRGDRLAQVLAASRVKPFAMALPDDRDIRLGTGFLRFARRHSVRTATVSFARSDPKADAMRRESSPSHRVGQAPGRRLKAWMTRRTPLERRGDLVFTPPGAYVALAALGAELRAPWSFGGGRSDVVTVQNDATAAALVAQHVEPHRIVVTGQCSHDALRFSFDRRAALRSKLCADHAWAEEKPIVICALPVMGEHRISSASAHEEDTSFLLQSLAATGSNVLLSLHPRQKRVVYEPLGLQHGIPVSKAPLAEILPAADVFVAYSSTLEWAQGLGIPAIALEYFGLGYTMFADQPGIACVTERERLGQALDKALASAPGPKAAPRFDGGASERTLAAVTGQG